ncbi:putative premnaspirodiene oxygenase [Rosa chinensis]|uniref:Putative premnaspirodiene oxygenase n=1 Tax=Rosa chinensis TaxID=74649 RepID=A0A2P6P5G6_ROSCH|nr:cytochrome P450 71A9 [Rosa chinensis]PRQ17170.1 putative premnaspirodiene oxygenase [Rosa chinensis]
MLYFPSVFLYVQNLKFKFVITSKTGTHQLAMSSYLSLSMVLLLFIFLIPFTFLLLMKRRKQNVQAKRLPPGPRRLPVIGNLHHLSDDLPHCAFEHPSSHYGPIMFLQLGSRSTLVVSSAEMTREVFKTHDLIFSGRPEFLYVAKRLSYDSSVSFSPIGKYWREVRKIVILELLSAKRIQMFRSVRDEEVGHMIDDIAHTSNGLINLNELTHFLSNRVLCRSAFGKKYDGAGGVISKNRIFELLEEAMNLLGGFCISDFLPWMGWLNKFNGLEKRVDKCFKGLDSFYDKVIEEHLDPKRPTPEHEDLVDVLLRVQKDPSQAIALTNDQIKGVITDIFIAGTDTSSATVVWTMAELIRNPLVMRNAQDEVRGVVKAQGKVEESDLSELMYLKLVIKESFRLHPPVPSLVPRVTTESCTIEGYEIPAKTMVFILAKMIGRDPKCWENPNEFFPERFLDSSIDYKGNHFELLPFGAGRRGCPGMNFAMQLVELTLANLLYRFDWELPDGMKREDLNMEEAAGITVQNKVPLYLAATPVHL